MAFCNACGASLMPGAQFCNKCGAAVPGVPVAPAGSTIASSPGGGSNALKIVLIVVAVVVAIGILGIVSLGLFIHHMARNSHIQQEGNHVKVETPFGNVETSADPAQLAKDIGIDVYPGAEVQKNGSATTTFGSMHSASAVFTTGDPVDKVCEFYRSRVSNAMVATSDRNRCTFVSNDPKNMLTINIEKSGDTTKIQITSVSKKAQ